MKRKMKTYDEWPKGTAFGEWAKDGDMVDEAIVMHFAESCSPATMTQDCVQCGEPIRHRDGIPRYRTFIKLNNKWFHVGEWKKLISEN